MELLATVEKELLPVPNRIARIHHSFFQKNGVVPLGLKEDPTTLVVAVCEGENGAGADVLSIFSGMPLEKKYVPQEEFLEYLNTFREEQGREVVIGVVEDLGESALTEIAQEIPSGHDLLDDAANEPPIIKLVNLLFTIAVKDRASDIHIQPLEKDLRVRFRIDGLLYDTYTPPKRAQNAIVSRIKVMAGLDVAEKRLPQDGRIKVRVNEKEIDVRVSIIPSTYGEQVVMRLLDRGAALIGLDSVGMVGEFEKKMVSLITRPQGVFLVTGPTGSGKTTTLYAVLQYINTPEKNILTVEDPVEYVLQGIGQIQVNPKIQLDFAKALRSFLRQDPDVIMVGEIRDEETARIAIQAALTGHLVFSTLHTNDSASALTRLVDMGIEPYLLTSSVTAILAQRLVRRLCPHCREVYEPTEFERKLLDDYQGSSSAVVYKGKGCPECLNTGYLGRIGIFELLTLNSKLRQMVQNKASSEEIKAEAIRDGMVTLRQDGINRALAGDTSLAEIMRVTIE
ncbi:MAG: Type II secretion system protein E [Syntrophorhabdaceae bacterium PtaU1.Bin034]|nr:MAG: Type II secretion system protein E [Syntrophorhabdaceae bacterium PtaU1.Bin034]